MPLHSIYTLGYMYWTREKLAAELMRLGAKLVDIRYSPRSSRIEWSKSELQAFFGQAYIHMPELGNVNYQGGPVRLANPNKVIQPIERMLQEQPCILMCACGDWDQCHRRHAAQYFAQHLGVQVEHLEVPMADLLPGHIRVITVRQPWAWAIMHGGKDIENRDHRQFATLRGPVAIHCSKHVSQRDYNDAAEFIAAIGDVKPPSYQEAKQTMGHVLGLVEVEDFLEMSNGSAWFFGPYGLLLRNPQPFEVSLPAKGKLGVWQWEPPHNIEIE